MSKVLALKYRPSSFDKLIGQERITQTLTLALDQNRLSHAYLFSGLRGSGKTSTARILAKSLVCDNGPTSRACGVCENCIMASENRHIDIIEMDAASSRKIDDIRSLIEQTKYKPSSARFKIFIIDEVHMLTREAFNALLKTLEEPPEYIKFILATTDPMKLPATILSRTQHFRFQKISKQNIKHHLSHILNLEKIEYENEALDMISRAGNGSLRDTLTMLDQAIIFSKGFVDAKSVASMLGLLDPQFLEDIMYNIFANDKEKIIKIIKELDSYESEVVIDEMIAFVKDRFFESDARFSTMISDRFFRILSEAKNLLFLNADNGFVLTLLFFKMIEATKIKEIDKMIDELEGKISIAPSATLIEPAQEVQQTPPLKEEKVVVEATTQSDHGLFQKLIDKLYDRNIELAECFKNSVSFIKHDEQKLYLESSAKDECKDILRHSSGIIKHFIQELYGIETQIAMSVKKNDEIKPTVTQKEILHDNSKEETEKKENKPDDILNDPFIKKAQELFEPSRIIVKSKI